MELTQWVVGAINGLHMHLHAPLLNQTDYYKSKTMHKSWYSILT